MTDPLTAPRLEWAQGIRASIVQQIADIDQGKRYHRSTWKGRVNITDKVLEGLRHRVRCMDDLIAAQPRD